MKKNREVLHVEHFKYTYGLFPAGEIEPTERPDFLVHTSTNLLGIEHTEIFQPGESDGASLQAQDNLAQRVVSQASEIFSCDHVQSLYVQVLFHPRRAIIKQEVTRLAKAIVDAIEKTPFNPGVVVTINHAARHAEHLPKEVAMIHLYAHPNGRESLWRASSVGFIPELTADYIQEKIDGKEQFIAEYKLRCAELWLLIVADDLRIPSVVDLSPSASEHIYNTAFDKVFLFWNATRRYMELHLSRNRQEC